MIRKADRSILNRCIVVVVVLVKFQMVMESNSMMMTHLNWLLNANRKIVNIMLIYWINIVLGRCNNGLNTHDEFYSAVAAQLTPNRKRFTYLLRSQTKRYVNTSKQQEEEEEQQQLVGPLFHTLTLFFLSFFSLSRSFFLSTLFLYNFLAFLCFFRTISNWFNLWFI